MARWINRQKLLRLRLVVSTVEAQKNGVKQRLVVIAQYD